MTRSLRRHAPEAAAVVALVVLAAAVAAYILAHQRLTPPWQDRYRIVAELGTAQAFTPGQGQPVTVAGVHVGRVGDVQLSDGRALVTMELERRALPAVHRDARVQVRPRTPLEDMVLELDPGRATAARLRDGDHVPLAQTLPSVRIEEVLSTLDVDTRDYLQALLQAGAEGLDRRSGDLRRLLKASAPTLEATRRVSGAIAARNRQAALLVSELRKIAAAAAARPAELEHALRRAAATFGAVGAEHEALRSIVARLPRTLRTATAALGEAEALEPHVRGAERALRPVLDHAPAALDALAPVLQHAPLDLRATSRAIDASHATVGHLRSAVDVLVPVTPLLRRSFGVLTDVVNELAHEPAGDEDGYLFWLAWFAHNGASMVSAKDAQGSFWRGLLMVSCSTPEALLTAVPKVADALAVSRACPEGGR